MDKIMRTYRYRLYPTSKQEVSLNRTLFLCKDLYNIALHQRKTAWRYGQESVKYRDQANELKEFKKKHSEYREVHSQVVQDVLRRLDKSFQTFLKMKKGYPRFKSFRSYHSIIYPQSGFNIEDNKLYLSKIGKVKIILHRPLVGKVKTLTVKKQSDGKWYACFTVEYENGNKEPESEPKNPIGIDVGLTDLLTLNTGEKLANPRWIRKTEQRLKRAQRKLSRKKKGSKNRAKQRLKVARIHSKVRNQRNDYHHKLSKFLVEKFDCIVAEKLTIKNMLRNRRLSKSISDVSWGSLFNKIAYKAESAGKRFVQVPPHGTSQNCSSCGTIVPKKLSERVHDCPECGLRLDRDVNAAINILRRGLESLFGGSKYRRDYGNSSSWRRSPLPGQTSDSVSLVEEARSHCL